MHPHHKFQLFLLLGSVFHNALGAKIIHGGAVSDNSMVYMASLQNNKRDHICGGFLISEDFVLTAAHCEGVSTVVLGTHHLKSATEDMRYGVNKCKHPSYQSVSTGNDIMLLKLSRKAQGVQTVDLGPAKPPGTDCQVAGWGKLSSRGYTVKDLQQVSVSIISEKDCKKKWGYLPNNIVCTGVDNGKGFCQGDSGGPLVCNNVAVGIVSFNRKGNCDYKSDSYPNVYTDISKFLNWINSVLAKGHC